MWLMLSQPAFIEGKLFVVSFDFEGRTAVKMTEIIITFCGERRQVGFENFCRRTSGKILAAPLSTH